MSLGAFPPLAPNEPAGSGPEGRAPWALRAWRLRDSKDLRRSFTETFPRLERPKALQHRRRRARGRWVQQSRKEVLRAQSIGSAHPSTRGRFRAARLRPLGAWVRRADGHLAACGEEEG